MKARFTLFVITFSLFSTAVFAQKSINTQSIAERVQTAKELFAKSQFVSAGQQFRQIAASTQASGEQRSEASYYQALCAIKADPKKSKSSMEQFLHDNPESPYTEAANFELAQAWFRDKQYAKALKIYQSLTPSVFSFNDQLKITYQKGYCEFQLKQYAQAEKNFNRVRNGNSEYAAPATYYWGHINYMNGNFDNAIAAFEKLQNNPAFAPLIPFYMSQIYYKQENYAKVIDYTEPLIAKADKQQVAELSKILGSSYFHLEQFGKAIPHLERYFLATGSKQCDENYLLAYCYYKNGQFDKAIRPFELASTGNDQMAQNAYYHLADCFIRTGDKNKARIAFGAAADMDYDAGIKEDALFNYAKITYELSYSPFNETINAFDKYIGLYPQSDRNDAAYNYLVQVYMSTNNFKDAMASIAKIKTKNQAIRKAYQRVTYYRGLEQFNSQLFTEAISCFDLSLENGEFNPELKAEATFWKAEANYRLGNYADAISGFERFAQLPTAKNTAEYQSYNYNLGYAYFKLKNYSEARQAFNKYIQSPSKETDKLADAHNRLGDCAYIDRDFVTAQTQYNNALNLGQYDADYALFQKAMSQGVQRQAEQKIVSLKSLLNQYPNSPYVDDALFEIGRTYERQDQLPAAVSNYKNLLDAFPQSSYRPKALLQLGLIAYNQSDYNQSMNYYKQVVEKYPDSEEAQAALLGIKNNYVEQNNVDGYLAYSQRKGSQVQISTSEQDSLNYQAAEKLVMSKSPNARRQLEYYLQNYPNGAFVINARFYLAEANYNEGQYAAALNHYEFVLDRGDNIFTEQALARAAELQYNAANYGQALANYQRLEANSGNKWNLLKAKSGIMRCQYQLGNFIATIEAARQVLATENLTESQKNEANFMLAQGLRKTGNENDALPIYTQLGQDTQTAEGAESKYHVAEILFAQNKNMRAENEIMDFISKNTPHQLWLAKSFILLADIYTANGDQFQAKHTLMSMIENYPETNDGIIDAAKAKLQNLEELEQQLQQQKPEPMQIDPNR